MSKKIKIGILGIGAVGGYFGGLLAEKYFDSEDVEIIFIARERSIEIIKEKGLKIITPQQEKIVFPQLISNTPTEIGTLDYLICCVKGYDLAESIISYKDCIDSQTIILPLLNGVNAKEIIHAVLPNTTVWDGCVYIISRLIEPGVISEGGNIHSFYFGSEFEDKRLKQFYLILMNSGIDAYLSENIKQTIWEKFVFISVVASLTSYLDLPVGPILENPNHRKTATLLLKEITAIAEAKEISLPENIIEKTMATIGRMPYATTSSMHSDFKKNGKTEYASLTKYIVDLGKSLRVETPEYSKISIALNAKSYRL